MEPLAYHWLRQPHRTRTPAAVFTLDVEGQPVSGTDGRVDRFRLAVCSYDRRRASRDDLERTDWTTEHDPRALWSWISARAIRAKHAVLFAHGLHYDYVTSRAHLELPPLGWTLVRASVTRGCRWLVYGRGRNRLTLVDTFNYLPIPLAEIGKGAGRSKLRMPPHDAPSKVWERYCRRDVEILRAAMLHLLDWWDAESFGTWALTSAGLAFAAFRTRFLSHRVLIHGDRGARELEREALFGGRREIYRRGELEPGPWIDLDYVSHYSTVAGATEVPIALAGTLPRCSLSRYRAITSRMGAIARVTVTTDEPLVPLRDPRLGVVYPVGTFRTTLCGPEIDLLLDRGADVKIGKLAAYQTAPLFADWSDWLLGRLYGRDKEPDELCRRMLKDWSHRLVGKFGQRAANRPPVEITEGGTEVHEITITEDGTRVADVWRELPPADPMEAGEGRLAVPQVTAWVHSAARVWLWNAMEACGFPDVAWCDTDGIMVRVTEHSAPGIRQVAPQVLTRSDAGAGSVRLPLRDRARTSRMPPRRSSRWGRDDPPGYERRPGTMIPKGVYSSVVVTLPQDYILDGRTTIKGVPAKARELDPRTFEVEYWPNIPWQLRMHRGEVYERIPRIVHVRDSYLRGWITDEGRVLPLEYEIVGGSSQPVAWGRTRWRRRGFRLADRTQAREIRDRTRL